MDTYSPRLGTRRKFKWSVVTTQGTHPSELTNMGRKAPKYYYSKVATVFVLEDR